MCNAWDDNSGVGKMQVSNAPDFAGAGWRDFAARSPWTLGENGVVYVRFRDNAGNVSETHSAWLGKTRNTYVPVVLKQR